MENADPATGGKCRFRVFILTKSNSNTIMTVINFENSFINTGIDMRGVYFTG